jgi:hypothetical protein
MSSICTVIIFLRRSLFAFFKSSSFQAFAQNTITPPITLLLHAETAFLGYAANAQLGWTDVGSLRESTGDTLCHSADIRRPGVSKV